MTMAVVVIRAVASRHARFIERELRRFGVACSARAVI